MRLALLTGVCSTAMLVAGVLLGVSAQPPAAGTQAEKSPLGESEVAGKSYQARGRITRLLSDEGKLMFSTADGKGMILLLDTDREVNIRYEVKKGNRVITALTVGDVPEPVQAPKANTTPSTTASPKDPPPAAAGQKTLQASVVRVLDDGQFVVRTEAGQELVLYGQSQTTYRIEDRAARFSDLRPGMNLRFNYGVKDNKNFVTSVVSVPKGQK